MRWAAVNTMSSVPRSPYVWQVMRSEACVWQGVCLCWTGAKKGMAIQDKVAEHEHAYVCALSMHWCIRQQHAAGTTSHGGSDTDLHMRCVLSRTNLGLLSSRT